MFKIWIHIWNQGKTLCLLCVCVCVCVCVYIKQSLQVNFKIFERETCFFYKLSKISLLKGQRISQKYIHIPKRFSEIRAQEEVMQVNQSSCHCISRTHTQYRCVCVCVCVCMCMHIYIYIYNFHWNKTKKSFIRNIQTTKLFGRPLKWYNG